MIRSAPLFACPMLLFAQVAGPPAFEAASVKPSNPDASDKRISFQTNPGGVRIMNEQLNFLIPYAWKIAVYQVTGGPAWFDSSKYDIVARAPDGPSEEQLRSMLQTLLVQRFGLKFHREQREMPVYALVSGKDGPKFQVEKRAPQDGDGKVGAGRGQARGHMVSSSVFAQTLSLFLGRPVLDQTGIDGLFNFDLKWAPDETERQLGPAPSIEINSSDQLPSLFAALQEQLGLRLVGQKKSVEMFVIDHIEQTPIEN